MKKRFLALLTTIAILSSLTINFVFATSTPGTGVSGSVSGEISGEGTGSTPGVITPTPAVSGEISGDIPGDTSGEVSGEISGEVSGEASGEEITLTALNDEIEIDKNTILTSNFRATSSIENATLSYIIVEQPYHGTLVHTEATSADYTYTPDLEYVGEDYFTFKVSDGTNESNIAKITIKINQPSEEIIPFFYIDMQEHWANYSASHLAARGLIIGEEIGSRFYFYPNREMTRSDFMLFLLAITESNEDASIKIPEVKFADETTTPKWLIEAAKLAYAKGIIKGSADGSNLYLNPYHSLTRKEAVVMINNVLKLTNSTDNLTYTDASTIPSWALQAVKNLTAYKIIQGNDTNEFSPNKIISKAEAAEMCFKMIKQIEASDMPIVSGDVSGDIK